MSDRKYKYDKLPIVQQTGDEPFANGNENKKLLDFWRWAYSDIANNITRGVLAEYIVGSALRCLKESNKKEGWRDAWGEVDLIYIYVDSRGNEVKEVKIEVKCTSPYQSWPHDKLSQIGFDISPKYHSGHSDKNCIDCKGTDKERWAGVYVFCLLAYEDDKSKMTPGEKQKVNPLNLNQWRFYVVATPKLNELDTMDKNGVKVPKKSIGLSQLRVLNPIEYKFSEIEGAVKKLIEDGEISK